jgi:hypothetical protein
MVWVLVGRSGLGGTAIDSWGWRSSHELRMVTTHTVRPSVVGEEPVTD